MSVAWAKGGLVITREALDAVIADAVRGYAEDEEACGYLTGPSDDPLLCDEVVVMKNLARKLHEMDPEQYFRTARTFFAFNEKRFDDAVRRGEADGRPVKILYHSHLDAGAYFSVTDRAVMSMGSPPSVEGGAAELGPGPAWPLCFLVTSVRAEGVDDHKLFAWSGSDFVEVPFTVREPAGGE
ncbi:MAG: Mov34/MPN/PAD-1 family protein [Polyangiaceae bacterium]